MTFASASHGEGSWSADAGALFGLLHRCKEAEMKELAGIEQALASRRTPELLAVYGDALQVLGDPRGDLIAIDLHAAAHRPSAELAARKREQIDRWLGPELAARVLANGAVNYGFVDLHSGLGTDEVESMLANPLLHASLRGLAIEDHDPALRRAIDLVCARPPPWLEHLYVVRYPDAFDESLRELIAVDDDRAQALVRATPRLRQLTIAGANAVGELVHPNVTTICLYDYNAFGSLLRDGTPLSSVHELDFQFGDVPPADVFEAMLPPGRLPALRRLDLARNEALWRDQAFALVGTHPIMRQIAWLRVPSLRNDAHLETLERAVAGMSADAEVIVARAYAEHLPTRPPSPRVHVPAPRPWPPSDALRGLGRGALTITIPGQRDKEVELREAIEVMEAQFEALPEPARATWTELWLNVRRLPPDSNGGNAISFQLSAGALAEALAPLEFGNYQASWRDLRTALAERTGDTLHVRRWSLWR